MADKVSEYAFMYAENPEVSAEASDEGQKKTIREVIPEPPEAPKQTQATYQNIPKPIVPPVIPTPTVQVKPIPPTVPVQPIAATQPQGNDEYEPINFESGLPAPEVTQRGSVKESLSAKTAESQTKHPSKQSSGKLKPWAKLWGGLTSITKKKDKVKHSNESKHTQRSKQHVSHKHLSDHHQKIDEDADLQSRVATTNLCTQKLPSKKESTSYTETNLQSNLLDKFGPADSILKSITNDRNKKFTAELMEEWRLLERSNRFSFIIIASIWAFLLAFIVVFNSVVFTNNTFDSIKW